MRRCYVFFPLLFLTAKQETNKKNVRWVLSYYLQYESQMHSEPSLHDRFLLGHCAVDNNAAATAKRTNI